MSNSTLTTSPLRQLAKIISESVGKMDVAFEELNCEFPSLDTPFDPTSPSEALFMAPEVDQAVSLIIASCAQLIATVNVPALTLYNAVGGFHISSALRVAIEGNIVEILCDYPQGLHVSAIATKNNMDPIRISRVLRLLATHHIFIEIAPDVFANNRLSSIMDTLKSVEEIKAKPEDKHVGTPGMSALIEHSADEIFKGSAFMTETLLNPVAGHSEAPEHAPLSVAFKLSKPIWNWYEEPGNEYRLKRFAAAMEGSSKADLPNAILQGFKWENLPSQSVVVDIGGGLGHITLKLFERYPQFKFVVQDRPSVIEQAKEYWNRNYPAAITSGSVILQAHDFFTKQPIKTPSVFLCRTIVHDYGKVTATKILTHLRTAASADTKLLLIEQVVPYACRSDGPAAIGKGITDAELPEVPQPLLQNLGKANAIAYIGDLHMYVGLNGEERTLESFVELTKGSGWTIVRIFPIPGSVHKQILAVPRI